MSEFLNLAQVTDEDLMHARIEAGKSAISWGLHIPPHLDQEKISMNMSRLGSLHRVGAFTASIVREHQGNTSETLGVVGINPDGSAVAGKTSTKKAPEVESGLIDDPFFAGTKMAKVYGKPIVVHSINRPEAVQNVIEMKDKGASDEAAWSKALDDSIRLSFRKAGHANLIARSGKFTRWYDYTIAGYAGLDLVGGIETAIPPKFFMFYAGILAICAGIEGKINQMAHGAPMYGRRRWSIFLDNQADRYIALNALSRLPRLVSSKE